MSRDKQNSPMQESSHDDNHGAPANSGAQTNIGAQALSHQAARESDHPTNSQVNTGGGVQSADGHGAPKFMSESIVGEGGIGSTLSSCAMPFPTNGASMDTITETEASMGEAPILNNGGAFAVNLHPGALQPLQGESLEPNTGIPNPPIGIVGRNNNPLGQGVSQ
jgi:hypothetical protein